MSNSSILNYTKHADQNIPVELRERPQWVCWRAMPKPNGKITKIPLNPKSPDRKASSTNPNTWASYKQAGATYHRHQCDGIGFVFSPYDPYTGIDLDKCVGCEGILEPWAQGIVDAMDSYTEWSPSGYGVHIIVRGELPPGRRRRGRIEVYDQARFFTMTGRIYGDPRPIALRDIELETFVEDILNDPDRDTESQIDTRKIKTYGTQSIRSGAPLPDRDIITRMLSATNGARLRALWCGDLSAYGSHSEADLALIANLAWWCQGDVDQVDRLFRQSGLYREKWDRADYRELTIARAMEGGA